MGNAEAGDIALGAGEASGVRVDVVRHVELNPLAREAVKTSTLVPLGKV